MPLITPVPVSNIRPAGREPPLILQVTGEVPPVTVSAWLYERPTTPFTRLVVRILGGGLMVIGRFFETVAPVPVSVSVTATEKLPVTEGEGVLVIAPLVLSDKPAGSPPGKPAAGTDHDAFPGALSPLAVRVNA